MKPLDGLTIGVDVDDVIYNLLKEWLARYNRDYNDNLTIEDIHAWDMTLFVKPECGKKIYDYLLQEDLYDNVETFPYTQYSLETFRDMGAAIKIITANHNPSKHRRLIEDGIASEDEIFVAEDKSTVPVDFLIDDYHKNLTNHTATGIMVNRPHNKYAPWKGIRANDWLDISIKILQVVEEQRGF